MEEKILENAELEERREQDKELKNKGLRYHTKIKQQQQLFEKEEEKRLAYLEYLKEKESVHKVVEKMISDDVQ
jgi:hypothetical protein